MALPLQHVSELFFRSPISSNLLPATNPREDRPSEAMRPKNRVCIERSDAINDWTLDPFQVSPVFLLSKFEPSFNFRLQTGRKIPFRKTNIIL